ncbi:MAG: hypothetical protein ACREJC_02035 [Tepidisphaeraceae bacterium]
MALTLRQINRRMRLFNEPGLKQSRRQMQYGGTAEKQFDIGTEQLQGSPTNDQDTRTVLEGDTPALAKSPFGLRAYYQEGGPAFKPFTSRDPVAEQVGFQSKPVAAPLDLRQQPRREWRTGAGFPRSLEAPTAYGRRVEEGELGRMIRPGFQDGGEVDMSVGRVEYEEPEGFLEGLRKRLERPEDTVPVTPEEQAVAEKPYVGLRPYRAPMTEVTSGGPSVTRPGTAGQTPVGLGGNVPSGAPSYTPDTEAAANERIKGLKSFGLDPFSARDTTVAGAPGVTKYRDASGKTLYANTLEDVRGLAPSAERVKEAQGMAKAESDKLTAAIQARLASGSPEDIEKARQLAVTPEQRAMIGGAENLSGLRARAARGNRGALIELQGMGAAGAARTAQQADLYKFMLGREPTALQKAEFGLRERELAQKTGTEQRATNLASNRQAVNDLFGEDKAGATRFFQRFSSSAPELAEKGMGDLSRVSPDKLHAMAGASKLLDIFEAENKPGWVRSFFGAKAPRYDRLLDALGKAEIKQSILPGGGQTITLPGIGKVSEGDVDPGTWRWMLGLVRPQPK